MDRTVADPMIGRVLDGRYRVGARIARGGMATVYEATDLRLDRVCALKVMHSGLGDDSDFVARFVREARSAARLSHPNVVGVFDQGEDAGTVFLAMEYIPGRTLRDPIRTEAPMPPSRALALLDPVLSALAAAHQAGMIHRDVKPENVLISDDGRVKVADFGLARAVSAETQHTATGGVLIGTVSYLSPELVVDGRADARSDVYAAGVLLYEMLTGRKPHEGESPIQIAYKHVHEDVPPPSREQPELPAYVDALVARATARDRDLRPADARVLLHQVRRVRSALDHGLVDDPELTADLTPTTAVPRGGHGEVLDDVGPEDVPTILTAAQAAHPAAPERAGAGADHTTVLPARRGAPPARPTAGPATRPGSRPRRRGPALLVLALVLVVLAGVGGWWFGLGRYTATPGVIDLTATQARHKVTAAGLQFAVTGRAFSETVRAGSVVSTDPQPGSRILHDGTVDAVVSKGPERHQVPAVRGMSGGEAQQALQRSHLSFGTLSHRYDARMAKGVVLGSRPKTGVELRRGTAVDLVVSKGPRPIKVPDWTGRSGSKAEAALSKLGFAVKVTRRHDDTVPRGQVISQDPSSGTAFRHDPVRLVVSKGPVMVDVPKVTGMGVADAEQTLRAAGFKVDEVNSQLYVGLGYVVHQDPGSGDRVPRGSVVTISLV